MLGSKSVALSQPPDTDQWEEVVDRTAALYIVSPLLPATRRRDDYRVASSSSAIDKVRWTKLQRCHAIRIQPMACTRRSSFRAQ